MKHSTGFNIVAGAIVAMILVIMVAQFTFALNSGNQISFGVNGAIEQRCINGYAYVVGQDGNVRQTMDEFGKGVKCQKN